jgi:hypothetical protein
VLSRCLALAAPYVRAQAEAPAPKLAAGAIQAQANGRIELRPDAHMPLFVEFDHSPALKLVLVAMLQAQGVRITPHPSEAKAELAIRGDVVLLGNPVFQKGTKVPMGEATEKTLAAVAANRGNTAGQATDATVTVAGAESSGAEVSRHTVLERPRARPHGRRPRREYRHHGRLQHHAGRRPARHLLVTLRRLEEGQAIGLCLRHANQYGRQAGHSGAGLGVQRDRGTAGGGERGAVKDPDID